MKSKTQSEIISIVILITSLWVVTGCVYLNDYQDSGELSLRLLKKPVRVIRDEKGMPYVHAENRDDAIVAYGFVTAQDRLFQMELTRLFASGRLCEIVGEKARNIDIRNRTIGFFRNAVKQAAILNQDTRKYLQNYVDGINAYIETRPDTHHLEFKLAGIRPQPWSIEDALCITFYLSWGSAANLKTEIVAQRLLEKLGRKRAVEIFPININPDDAGKHYNSAYSDPVKWELTGLAEDENILALLENQSLSVGSNNWVTASICSAGGKPIVSNDPHLNAGMLPGPLYPCGLITPEIRIVGVALPGSGAFVAFRSEHIAVGITNAYGDVQDLYVETLDPENTDNYLEGTTSRAFEIIEETLAIKDKAASNGLRKETITIRLTKRGPVVSGIWSGLKSKKVITLRWTPFETIQPDIGIYELMYATSVNEIRQVLEKVNIAILNFVFADVEGNIGWQVTGKLPIRSQGDGTIPYPVKDGSDNWTGWIPFQKMPHAVNPENGWIGTCNHYTVKHDYPYYYTSHSSPSYRYRRLTQLMQQPGKKAADDHWRFQQDDLNLMARDIAPLMAAALLPHPETMKMGQILSEWNYHDDPDQTGPTIFQNVYRHFARGTFLDDLGDETTMAMLGNWYFWQERLHEMIKQNKSAWFDDINTPNRVETRDDLFYQAALEAKKELEETLGSAPEKWLWGEVHTIEYVSPARRQGFGKGLLGGGKHPAGGSGETLLRNYYDFNKPFEVIISDALRMVADLGDPDKVMAILSGGVTGRVFHPHYKDQIEPFMKGEKRYWWFSERAILEHQRDLLLLIPENKASRKR
jgi:penicillin amidase